MKIRRSFPLVAAVFLGLWPGFLWAAGDVGTEQPATYEQLQKLAVERKWPDIVAILNQNDLTGMADALGQPVGEYGPKSRCELGGIPRPKAD